MRLWEVQWLAEEAQWLTRGPVHGRGGGVNRESDAVLIFLMPAQARQGGGRSTLGVAVAEAEAEAEEKREVGANSDKLK